MSEAVVRKLTNDHQRSDRKQNAGRVSRFTFDVSTVESIRSLYSGIYNVTFYNHFVALVALHKSNIYCSRFGQKNILSVCESVPTAYYTTAEMFIFAFCCTSMSGYILSVWIWWTRLTSDVGFPLWTSFPSSPSAMSFSIIFPFFSLLTDTCYFQTPIPLQNSSWVSHIYLVGSTDNVVSNAT